MSFYILKNKLELVKINIGIYIMEIVLYLKLNKLFDGKLMNVNECFVIKELKINVLNYGINLKNGFIIRGKIFEGKIYF